MVKSFEFWLERRDGATPLQLMLMRRKSVSGVWEMCCCVVQLKGGVIWKDLCQTLSNRIMILLPEEALTIEVLISNIGGSNVGQL